MASNPNHNVGDEPPVVHFATKDTEIPDSPAMPVQREYSNQTQEQINQLSGQLNDSHIQNDSHLQNRRMSNFQFETISLPASRVSPAASVASSVHNPTPRSNSQSRFTASQMAPVISSMGATGHHHCNLPQPIVARSSASFVIHSGIS